MYILQNVFLKISDTVRVLSNFLLFLPFRYMHHTKSWPFLLTLMYMYMYMFMYMHAVTYRTGTSHAIVQFSTPKLCTTKIVSNLQWVCLCMRRGITHCSSDPHLRLAAISRLAIRDIGAKANKKQSEFCQDSTLVDFVFAEVVRLFWALPKYQLSVSIK